LTNSCSELEIYNNSTEQTQFALVPLYRREREKEGEKKKKIHHGNQCIRGYIDK